MIKCNNDGTITIIDNEPFIYTARVACKSDENIEGVEVSSIGTFQSAQAAICALRFYEADFIGLVAMSIRRSDGKTKFIALTGGSL